MNSNTIKINAVIASRDRLHSNDKGYRTFTSVEEMTPEMRRQYEKCMAGDYTGTILIFDPKGKEEILRTLRGEKTSFNASMPDSVRRQLRKVELTTSSNNSSRLNVDSLYCEWMRPLWVRLSLAFGVPLVLTASLYWVIYSAR